MIEGTGKFAEGAAKRGGSARLLVLVVVGGLIFGLVWGFAQNLRALFGS
jgi:hypothetical protein